MIGLGYLLAYLLKRTLPWTTLTSERAIFSKKISCQSNLCSHSQIQTFLDYVFQHTVMSYDYLLNLFSSPIDIDTFFALTPEEITNDTDESSETN